MKISINGNWQLYWGVMSLPEGAQACGTVKRSVGETGALILLKSGNYVQGNAGEIRTLDQSAIKNALSRSNAAAALGSIKTPAKAAAARENGKKGGWPKGRKRK